MTTDLSKRLDEIRAKTLEIKRKSDKLEKINADLEQEQKRLKELLEQEVEKTKELQNKIKIIKLAQNISSSGLKTEEISELKRKLNEYIKEIDNCIMMMND